MKGPPLPQLTSRTLSEALANAAQSGAAGLTFIDAREQETACSWQALHARSLKIAAGLRERGIRAGDRVAIVLPTSVAFCEAFFGVVLAGAVPVPLYPPVRLGRMEEYQAATAQMLELSGAGLVVSAGALRLLLGGALARVPRRLEVVPVEALTGTTAQAPSERASPDDLALIQFSSGSTVAPKPVALTHTNMLAQCAALKAMMPEAEDIASAGVSWLPLYHDMGLIGALLTAVYWPGPLALLPPELFLSRPALWLRAISRHRATVSPAPNFAYGLCLKRITDEELEGVDLSCWRYALNGAEPVSPDLLRRFSNRFARWGLRPSALRPVYGLSEATLAVTWSPPRPEALVALVDPDVLATQGRVAAPVSRQREVVSVGIPVPGAEVEVRAEDGSPVGEDRLGRIHVRGASVMAGYYGRPDETAKVLDDGGWLDTGDLGFWHGGELHVCGRSKDLVIVRGANHAPQEFEEAAMSVPGVRAGCVVALGFVPEGADGEALLVLAEWAEGARDSLGEEVSAEVLRRTGVRPHTVRVLAPGTLPRTSSGKLRRGEALRLFLGDALRPPGRSGTLQVVSEVVRSAAAWARAERER